MEKIRISPQGSRVALAVQFNANARVPELRKLTGLREHVIHYQLSLLRERQLIRPWLALNHLALGLQQFDVFFSLAGGNPKVKEKLLKVLGSSRQVLWFAEVGGEYQIAFSLYCPSAQDADAFLKSLATICAVPFLKKSVVTVISFALFKKKFLAPDEPNLGKGVILFERPKELVSLDATDRTVLSALYKYAALSQREIARQLKMAASSFQLRVKRLEENGVIEAFIYHISSRKLGMLRYKVLVNARGIQAEIGKSLFNFAQQSPFIVNFGYCLGSWDFELGIEVAAPEDILSVTDKIYGQFGACLNEMQIIPVFSQVLSSNFMQLFS